MVLLVPGGAAAAAGAGATTGGGRLVPLDSRDDGETLRELQRAPGTAVVATGAAVAVPPAAGLCVLQRECVAVAVPHARACGVQWLGSCDATTCVIVTMRTADGLAAAVAHLDDEVPDSIRTMLHDLRRAHRAALRLPSDEATPAAQSPAPSAPLEVSPSPLEPIEVGLAGGYPDDKGSGAALVRRLLVHLASSQVSFTVVCACVAHVNTKPAPADSPHAPTPAPAPALPAAMDVALDLASGALHRVAWGDKGPLRPLRGLRFLSPEKSCASVTDGITDDAPSHSGSAASHSDPLCFCVRPWPYRCDAELCQYLLALPDAQFLEQCSTTPLVEPPEFVRDLKASLAFSLAHRRASDVWPGATPLRCVHTPAGWQRAGQG